MTEAQRQAIRAAFHRGGGYTEGDPYGGYKLDWGWDPQREAWYLHRRDAWSDAEDIEVLDEERFWKTMESIGWEQLATQLDLGT